MTRATFWRAWSVWAVTMAITATAISYDALNPLPATLADQSGNGLDMVVGLAFVAAFATVGALLAWKRPGNPIGWLLSGSGLAYALGGLGQLLIHFPRTRTLGNWLGWTWLVGLGLCVFVVLLFPSGNLPSRRWRPVAFAARLKDTVDLNSVRDDLTGTVSRALEPAHVSVWISRPQDGS